MQLTLKIISNIIPKFSATNLSEMKKLILGLSTLIMSSMSFANCYINYAAKDDLKSLIQERKFVFDGYDKLCKRLEANDAGISFTSITQVSPYQTTASVTITMYPKGDKYKGVTLESTSWIQYEKERTSSTEKEALYEITMHALSNLTKPNSEEKLKKILIEVNEMRKATK